MRLVFAGTPEPAVPALQRLIDSEHHEVVGVITRPDAASGRGRKVHRSPVGELADAAGIPVITPAKLAEPDAVAQLREWAPDCCPVVAYGGLVPADLLDLPEHGWVNLHFSLLPAWRGAAPVQAAIEAGDEMTGAATFRIEKGLDTGPVFGVVTEPIRPQDTSGDLLERLADAGSMLLEKTMDGLAAGELQAVPQSADGVSTAPKVDVAHAQIDWARPAFIIDRKVRAMTPAPGAWTTLGDDRLKLGPVTPMPDGVPGHDGPVPAGAVVVTKKAVFVGTATDVVRLSTVQAPGKKAMAAADWARGARVDGEVLR
ncbi:methionyl-tRNA formyltransferase [Jongsikchunia kroppenstedtii]|uniref:methionyl-tRNA formyltransferase n=1 Tax=Jongsikchunia kroppenstedtii TaxID=1121721 RepID=UPI00037B2E91|nr:methionyl-tRNA formyltransferase [Jongsikchunia kroppenstedtii]